MSPFYVFGFRVAAHRIGNDVLSLDKALLP
jgi:hypothetical protein